MHEVSTKIGGHLVMEDDDQKLRVRLVSRNGRRRYDPASKDRLVAACARTWGQCEPSSEVDKETHGDPVPPAILITGVYPGSD